jgi:H+/Cl- antiporter ClcA
MIDTPSAPWKTPSWDRSKTEIYIGSAMIGVVSGFVVVAYRALISLLEGQRESAMDGIGGSPPRLILWLCIAALAAFLTSKLIKASPLIKGSGIPQVKALLLGKLSFSWKKELPLKFIGGSLALGSGLSLGREGPSIQLGSLIGDAYGDLRHKREHRDYFVTAGAAAGISAAFNAPLAGVLFCIEELHKSFSPTMLTSTLISSFCANAVMWLCFGNSPVFSITLIQVLPLGHYFSAVLFIGVAAGLLGSLFNEGILAFQKGFKRLVKGETLRIVLAFLVAALVSVFASPLTGGGQRLISMVSRPDLSLRILCLMLGGKFLFTLFSYASGAPGGIFLPMLAIGALIGSIAQIVLPALGVQGDFLANYILLGMAAFFVAVVQAPITGAVLITEMAGSLGHFPAFMLVSVIAALTADLFRTKPIYDLLLEPFLPPHLARR